MPSLEIIPEVRDRWLEHDLILRLPDHVDELNSLRGFAMDVGNRDTPNVADFQAFDQALTDAGIPHQAEIYDGDHSNRRGERIALAMQYFSNVLITAELPGDFDGNGVLDARDVDLLFDALRTRSQDPRMDLSGNQSLGPEDRQLWISGNEFHFTYFGDANLDGEFNSSDLISALATGTYELDVHAGWASGDSDGSGRFDSSDLIVALADGGYEAGPRPGAVPEPSSFLPFVLALGWLIMCRKPV